MHGHCIHFAACCSSRVILSCPVEPGAFARGTRHKSDAWRCRAPSHETSIESAVSSARRRHWLTLSFQGEGKSMHCLSVRLPARHGMTREMIYYALLSSACHLGFAACLFTPNLHVSHLSPVPAAVSLCRRQFIFDECCLSPQIFSRARDGWFVRPCM